MRRERYIDVTHAKTQIWQCIECDCTVFDRAEHDRLHDTPGERVRTITAAGELMLPKQEPNGVELIAAERQRQIEVKGYTVEHDAGHYPSELIDAAVAYAVHEIMPRGGLEWWPWSDDSFKPSGDRVRDLVKAGALIAAAIDAEQVRNG